MRILGPEAIAFSHGTEIRLTFGLLHSMLELPPDVRILAVEPDPEFLEGAIVTLVSHGPCGTFDMPKLVEGEPWPQKMLVATKIEMHLEG